MNRTGWAVAAVSVLGAACLASAVPTISEPNRHAVVNGAAARRFLTHAAARRVDLAIIGDSNTRSAQVSGHEDGMGRAFAAEFGAYATRVDPVSGQGGWAGYIGGSSSGQAYFFGSGAPSEAAAYMFAGAEFPVSYGYLAPGQTVTWENNAGLGIGPDHPIGMEGNLRYHITYYSQGPDDTGEFHPTIRERYPGRAWINHSAPATIRTQAAEPGVVDTFVSVPAGERAASGILCALTDYASEQGAAGPLTLLWHRVENQDRDSGIGYSPLLYQGGRSARAACQSLLNIAGDDRAIHEWMRQLTRLQNGEPMAMIQIIHAGNDVNDSAPSPAGPYAGQASSTPDGHESNLRCIMEELGRHWASAGHDPANLYFLLGPYHPQADRIDRLREYEERWASIASTSPNVIAIRGSMLSTPDEFLARGYYQLLGFDTAHLTVPGYRDWGTAAARALRRAAWPVDIDENRATEVADIFAFLRLWFAATPAADFDANNAVEVADIFAFLRAWFAA